MVGSILAILSLYFSVGNNAVISKVAATRHLYGSVQYSAVVYLCGYAICIHPY